MVGGEGFGHSACVHDEIRMTMVCEAGGRVICRIGGCREWNYPPDVSLSGSGTRRPFQFGGLEPPADPFRDFCAEVGSYIAAGSETDPDGLLSREGTIS